MNAARADHRDSRASGRARRAQPRRWRCAGPGVPLARACTSVMVERTSASSTRAPPRRKRADGALLGLKACHHLVERLGVVVAHVEEKALKVGRDASPLKEGVCATPWSRGSRRFCRRTGGGCRSSWSPPQLVNRRPMPSRSSQQGCLQSCQLAPRTRPAAASRRPSRRRAAE